MLQTVPRSAPRALFVISHPLYFSRMVVILRVMPRRIAGQQRRTGDAPGWYPDDTDPGLERYFNGGSWTGQTRTARNPAPSGDEQDVPPLPVLDPRLLAADLRRESLERARVLYRWADILGAVVAVLAALSYLGCLGLAIGVHTPAAVAYAVGAGLVVSVWLVAGLLVVSWAKAWAVDAQHRAS